MTENEIIDFVENEINVLTLQRDGAFGSVASYSFKKQKGKKKIATFRTIIGLITWLKQYQAIGTVKECREAVERQKTICESAEKYADGKCIGYGKSEMDDEPIEMCKRCKSYVGFEESEEE